jgi:hypothetical protein
MGMTAWDAGGTVKGFASGAYGVRGFAALRVRGFAALRVRGFAALRVRGFAALRVRGLRRPGFAALTSKDRRQHHDGGKAAPGREAPDAKPRT